MNCYRSSLVIREKGKGKNSKDNLQTLNNLHQSCLALGHKEEAEEYLRQTENIAKKSKLKH